MCRVWIQALKKNLFSSSFFTIARTPLRRLVRINGKVDITVGPNNIAERKETSVLASIVCIICCMQTDTGFHFDFEVWVWNILYLMLNYFFRIIKSFSKAIWIAELGYKGKQPSSGPILHLDVNIWIFPFLGIWSVMTWRCNICVMFYKKWTM